MRRVFRVTAPSEEVLELVRADAGAAELCDPVLGGAPHGRQTLPGLGRFLMVGQWVQPGGGLPTGLMTARAAIQSICRRDRVAFAPQGAAQTIGHAA